MPEILCRLEYDAYRTDLEELSMGPRDAGAVSRLDAAQSQFQSHKDKYEKLRADVAIKLKFLEENKVGAGMGGVETGGVGWGWGAQEWGMQRWGTRGGGVWDRDGGCGMGMGSAGIGGAGMGFLQGFDSHVGFVTQGHESRVEWAVRRGAVALGGGSEGFPTPFLCCWGGVRPPPNCDPLLSPRSR